MRRLIGFVVKRKQKAIDEIINNALEVIPDNAEEIEKEKVLQARMDKYTRDLIACAEGKITRFDLEVPESITPWTEEQINAEIERIKTNPNRADKLKDFRLRKYQQLATDKEGREVYMAESPYALQMARENFPEINFHFSSEF